MTRDILLKRQYRYVRRYNNATTWRVQTQNKGFV